jgi:hypothetical protein
MTPLPSTVTSLAPASLAARIARAMSACVTLAGRRGITLSPTVRNSAPFEPGASPSRGADRSEGGRRATNTLTGNAGLVVPDGG